MEIARRDLLRLGAAVAVAGAASSCRTEDVSGRPVSVPSLRPDPVARDPDSTVPRGALFPGARHRGQLYFGASLPRYRSILAWEQKLGTTLSLNRSYFTPDDNETAQLVRRCREDLTYGRLPHVSIKPTWSWRDIASGRHDRWLSGIFRPLGEADGPVFFTLHHEPENDAGPPGMQPADYVAMQRRAIELAADLAPQVVVAPVMQHWTFDPLRDDIDASVWIVPEASVIGVDIYNPWSRTNGKEWRTFGGKADEVIGWFGDTPILIGEYGCRDDPQNPGLAAEWLRDAAEYARTHNIVSMSYFNSGRGAPEGSFELTGEAERAFAELLSADWVARPV